MIWEPCTVEEEERYLSAIQEAEVRAKSQHRDQIVYQNSLGEISVAASHGTVAIPLEIVRYQNEAARYEHR